MFRAIRVRRVIRGKLENDLLQEKKKLITSWKENSISLIYRTKFWLCFQDVSYLNLASIKDEIEKYGKTKGQTEKIKTNTTKLELSKKDLYVKLKKEIPEDVKNQLFTQFNIPVRSKKRKEHLVNALWNISPADFKDDKEKVEVKKEQKESKRVSTVKISAFEAMVNKHAKCYDLIIHHGHLDDELVADLADRFQLKRERRIKANLLTILVPTLLNLGSQQKNKDRLRASVIRGCEVIKLLQNEARIEAQEKTKLEQELQAVKLLLNGSPNITNRQSIQKKEEKKNKKS